MNTTSLQRFAALAAILTVLFSGNNAHAQRPNVPAGHGQLEQFPEIFRAGVDDEGREFFLNGQSAQNGKLIFTASNGFFSPGTCRASGQSDNPTAGETKLIAPNFEFLGGWKETDGDIRWHVWVANPGTVYFNANMLVTPQQAGAELQVSFAGQNRMVKTVAADQTKPQPWNLSFKVAMPGEHTFAISAKSIPEARASVGQLFTIDAFGPAIKGSQLLRVRWRPAAAHGGYASSTCKESRMWVMTTRSMTNTGSYSPITTPFGYYGTTFRSDRTSGGSFNFSMWAGGRGGKAPPLEQMPHLLAAGSPEAEFSGFGHEGSGVKLRAWTAMPDHPEVVVQALRVESDGNYHTYYGYFWDHPSKKWNLYAVGRKWNKGRMKHLRPGSFCEVPGPPDVQRTGDVVREVRRYGWFFGPNNTWHSMDQFVCSSKGITNKSWHTTPDGEFAMATGGMRHYRFEEPAAGRHPGPRPEFLSPAATEQLFVLPAEFGECKVTATRTSANVDLVVTRAGTNARAVVYYGEADCLTFVPRKLHGTERNSEISRSTQQEGRAWQHSVDIESVKSGRNSIQLNSLKPATTYYVRTLITNDEGKMWDFDSHKFRTR